MGFVGFFIANNLWELVGGICVAIVAVPLLIKLGRKLERQRLRKMGSSMWQGYLDDPKSYKAKSWI